MELGLFLTCFFGVFIILPMAIYAVYSSVIDRNNKKQAEKAFLAEHERRLHEIYKNYTNS